jgi:4-hydroxy-tetrahydrodipicolinate synthase
MIMWQGVFPAVTTKMNLDGSLDLTAMRSSIDRLIRGGVSSIIVLPMLGENTSLDLDERRSIIETAVAEAAGRIPVLSGLAETTLRTAKANAANYARWGAQGLMVFPSLGYTTDPRETAEWYRGIASVSDLPIMIYNNPIAYRVDVTEDVLRELVDVPQIQCIKEETGDIRRVTDTYNAFGDRFHVFCGVDDLIVESSSLGVTGWVSGLANVWPEICVRLFELCRANRYDEARELYRILTPAFHLDTHVKLVQYIKLAEAIVHGSPEWTRSPRLPLVGAERDFVVKTIETAARRLAEHG